MTDDTNTPHAPYGVPTDDESDRGSETSPHGPYGVLHPRSAFRRIDRVGTRIRDVADVAANQQVAPLTVVTRSMILSDED